MNNSESICLKCGGTGITFINEPCDCGSKPIEVTEISDIEKYIPELYRNREFVGANQEVNNIPSISLADVIYYFTENKEKSMSLLLDISNTSEGAYSVYYYIMERLINDNGGTIPKHLVDNIMVNTVNIPTLNKLEKDVENGEWHPVLIITEFPLERYKDASIYLKLRKFNKYIENSYPLNIYQISFKDKGGN